MAGDILLFDEWEAVGGGAVAAGLLTAGTVAADDWITLEERISGVGMGRAGVMEVVGLTDD